MQSTSQCDRSWIIIILMSTVSLKTQAYEYCLGARNWGTGRRLAMSPRIPVPSFRLLWYTKFVTGTSNIFQILTNALITNSPVIRRRAVRWESTNFQRNITLLFSGWKDKPSKKTERRWWWHVLLERRLNFNGLNSVISHKIEFSDIHDYESLRK